MAPKRAAKNQRPKAVKRNGSIVLIVRRKCAF